MSTIRRFPCWKMSKSGKAVNVGDVIPEDGTGNLYIIKNFCAAREDKPIRLKVLAWDKRVTGMIEVRDASDFGVTWG